MRKKFKRLGLQQALDESQSVSVKQGDESVAMPLLANDLIPDGCALLAAGTQASSVLGSAFGSIEITV